MKLLEWEKKEPREHGGYTCKSWFQGPENVIPFVHPWCSKTKGHKTWKCVQL